MSNFLVRRAGHIDDSADWLGGFLAEPELDNLMTRHTAADLTPGQEARVRRVVKTGLPRQPLFNLLICPQLIPADIRLEGLRAAIRQDADPYLRTAAVVGMQGDCVVVPTASWPAVRDELLGTLGDMRGSIRNRATVTLAGRIQRADGPAVVDAAVRVELHGTELSNLIGALAMVDADDAVLRLCPRLLDQGVPNPDVREWLEKWRSLGVRPADPAPRWFGAPALGYIPNLDG